MHFYEKMTFKHISRYFSIDIFFDILGESELPLQSWRNGPPRYTNEWEAVKSGAGTRWHLKATWLRVDMWSEVGRRDAPDWVRQAGWETTKSRFWSPYTHHHHPTIPSSFSPRGVCVSVSTHLAACFQLPQPSLHIISGWIEPHLSRERMEIKLLHNCVGDAAKDVTERESARWVSKRKKKQKTWCFSNTRRSGREKEKGKAAERREERMDNWHFSSLLLLARPSPAECRAVA